MDSLGSIIGALMLGALLGVALRTLVARTRAGGAEERAQRALLDARTEAERITRLAEGEASEQIATMRREAEEELRIRREEALRLEQRLAQREEALERRSSDLAQRTEELDDRDAKLRTVRERLESEAERQRGALERIAHLTTQEAREAIMRSVVDDAKREAMTTVRELEQRAREEGEERARKIVTTAIQRIATEQTAETTQSVLHLPSEESKGRIIGREGRNIRAFEAVTGVNLVIDDTPDSVVLSCFDPVRREVARLTLERLVADGRIHPARIEETHASALAEVEVRVRRAGEDAVRDAGITDIHPDLLPVLGRLAFRTSYGQNVLRHLVESAHIAASICAELGVDGRVATRGAFLHDLGKAVSPEVEGSHALVGADLARRMGESPEVVHCIESHHGEVEQRSLDAVITQIADGISGGRPGARRENVEAFIKRLRRIEEICTAHPGVEKTYAMQAGRDVRVIVKPEEIDDLAAQVMARDIAKQVEEELQYPGQIRITVVRETRATEFAR